MSELASTIRQLAFAFAIVCAASLAQAETLVDPTRPPIAAHSATEANVRVESALRVTAIIQSGGRCVAVVDGKVVKSGDRLGDVLIEAVTADGVRFKRAGRVEFARLPTQAAIVRRNVASEENEP